MDNENFVHLTNTQKGPTARSSINAIKFSRNLFNIKDRFNVFLFDMRGVLHTGNKISQKNLDFLQLLKNEGKKVIIASNNTSFSDYYIGKIKQKGLEPGIHFDFTITAGDVLKHMVENGEMEKLTQKDRMNVFVMDQIKDNIHNLFFKDHYYQFNEVKNIDEADLVLTGTPMENGYRIPTSKKLDYMVKRCDIFEAIKRKKIPVVVPNPDTKMPYENGMQAIGAGKFGKICKKYGAKVIGAGKPSSFFYDYIKLQLQLNNIEEKNEKIVMVGDSFATDIVGGNKAGFNTIAVVNKKSNIGLTLKKDSKKFVGKMKDRETKPTIIVNDLT